MNHLIITVISAWLFSQIAKVVYGLFRYGKDDFSRVTWRLIWAGGMPSSHSAFTTSAVVFSGLLYGLETEFFGLTLMLAIIVIYDRSKLNHIYKKFQEKYPSLKRDVQKDNELKDLVGHTTSEIIVGIIIGILTGIVSYIVFR